SRRPHDGTIEDLPEVVEDDEAAVFGGFHHAGIAVGSDGEPVGSADAGVEQHLHGPGYVAGGGGGVGPERDWRGGRGALDPGNAGGGPAAEDGDVFGFGDLAGGGVERGQVEVSSTPVDVEQLGPGDGEIDAEFSQGQDAALKAAQARGRGF